ncbi:MAG TPA: FAD-dependent oxidoreductase [Blastocatellia bacterium]|nr:FAD-dependent oxidoreductase [Blastocatellia bacterium]
MSKNSGVKTSSGTRPDLELDVAIIGAGVSGLYTGWRLLTGKFKPKGLPGARADSNVKPRVNVFELSDRIGGRLETIFFEGLSDVPAEFGGMRYTDQHVLVSSLVKELGLTSTNFPMGNQNNLWLLRGERLKEEDFSNPKKVPYDLRPSEKGKSPDQLIKFVLDSVLAENGIKKLPSGRQEWDEIKKTLKHRKEHIFKFGWWNLITDYLSSEAYQLITDGGGYYTSTMNWGAGEAMEFLALDFIPQPTYVTLKEGYDGIPIKLAQRFTDAGGEIWTRNGLVTFDHTEKRERGKPRLKLTIQNHASGKKWNVYAHNIVLALPQRSLELLQLSETFFDLDAEANQELNSLVYSVSPQPALKLFMGYEQAWWKAKPLDLSSGRSITDMPIRQIYYFGTETESERSLLMTSYDDGRAVQVWEGLGLTEKEKKKARRYPARGEGGAGDVYAAPQRMIEFAHNQLRLVHGVPIPQPYVAAYKDWNEDPYGGGWHLWNTQVKVWRVMPRIRQPLKDENVYICGEAYSGLQGWVEGALTMTELMMQKQLNMESPNEWLPKSYYLGY